MNNKYLIACSIDVKSLNTEKCFFNPLQGVWISDETLFQLFDIASQAINNSRRTSKQKLAKLYANLY
jgi:hypothetical protein